MMKLQLNFGKNNWIKNAGRWSNIVRCFLSISQRARMSARGCHASSLGLMPFSGSGFTSMPIGNSKWSGTRLIARGKKSFGAEFKQFDTDIPPFPKIYSLQCSASQYISQTFTLHILVSGFCHRPGLAFGRVNTNQKKSPDSREICESDCMHIIDVSGLIQGCSTWAIL